MQTKTKTKIQTKTKTKTKTKKKTKTNKTKDFCKEPEIFSSTVQPRKKTTDFPYDRRTQDTTLKMCNSKVNFHIFAWVSALRNAVFVH